jgi:oxidase EvaA
VAATNHGRVATVAQVRGGILHLLFAARPELGFREHVQYGPALQEFPGEASIDPAIESLTAMLEAALGRSELLLGAQQSDEGGRFFHSIATYGIHLLPEDAAIELGEHLAWMTLAQIEALIPRRGFFSNEARSLISMLLTYV